jgi:hypothetical protein
MNQTKPYLALGLFLTVFSSLVHQEATIAQSVPDNSLGAENFTTRPETIKNIPSDLIEGGASRGNNLFHGVLKNLA